MGSLYKRRGSKNWVMATIVAGRQICKSSHTTNQRMARKLLARWETEIFEGRFHLPASKPPLFENWAEGFLSAITHANTKKRYKSSVEKLKLNFSGMRLNDISAAAIEEFKEARMVEDVEPATINHDLRVLRRMMHIAERKRLIGRTPFVEVEFLKQQGFRDPHIVTFEEEERIISAAPPFLRVLIVLILETGLRSHREALSLRWTDVDFAGDSIHVRESKLVLESEAEVLQSHR